MTHDKLLIPPFSGFFRGRSATSACCQQALVLKITTGSRAGLAETGRELLHARARGNSG